MSCDARELKIRVSKMRGMMWRAMGWADNARHIM
jgi:hypothetical protein